MMRMALNCAKDTTAREMRLSPQCNKRAEIRRMEPRGAPGVAVRTCSTAPCRLDVAAIDASAKVVSKPWPADAA